VKINVPFITGHISTELTECHQ